MKTVLFDLIKTGVGLVSFLILIGIGTLIWKFYDRVFHPSSYQEQYIMNFIALFFVIIILLILSYLMGTFLFNTF